MRLYFLFTFAAAGLLSTGALFGATTAVDLSGEITSGGLEISSSGDFAFDSQGITSVGGEASVSAGAQKSVTINIADTRGTNSAIAIIMTYEALALGTHVRPVKIETSDGSDGFTANYTNANVSSDIDTAEEIASATAAYNRHGSFTLSVTPLALKGTNARAGAYTGTITLTVQ